jgi:hypothetical protein
MRVMLEQFIPEFGSQVVIVNNTPFTLTQTVEGDPWTITRGDIVIGQLFRAEPGGWGVWPMLDACTYVKQAPTPGEALQQAL